MADLDTLLVDTVDDSEARSLEGSLTKDGSSRPFSTDVVRGGWDSLGVDESSPPSGCGSGCAGVQIRIETTNESECRIGRLVFIINKFAV